VDVKTGFTIASLKFWICFMQAWLITEVLIAHVCCVVDLELVVVLVDVELVVWGGGKRTILAEVKSPEVETNGMKSNTNTRVNSWQPMMTHFEFSIGQKIQPILLTSIASSRDIIIKMFQSEIAVQILDKKK
jgi:hypothetical protein